MSGFLTAYLSSQVLGVFSIFTILCILLILRVLLPRRGRCTQHREHSLQNRAQQLLL